MKNLNPTLREAMHQGMNKEIDAWLRYKVCKAVPKHLAQGRTLMQMRWILTFKADGAGKGRIVVRGYQHESLGSVRTENPTASKRARQLFFTKLAPQKWR